MKIFYSYCFLFIVAAGISIESKSQDSKNYAVINNIPVTHRLPSNRNGLTETSFMVTAKLRMSRWENSADIILNLDYKEGTSDNPSPSFLHSYRYNGVEYGNQHVGYEPFKPIRVYQALLRFKILVQGNGNSYTKIVDVHDNTIAKVAKDAKASDYVVYVQGVESIDFSGTKDIEAKIQGQLNANKKKDAYKTYITQADASLNQKKWSDAASKYRSALALFPDEQYPQNQLNKIEGLSKKDKYDGYIKQADNSFNANNLADAKNKYKAALDVLPNESYPQNQISKIDALLKKADNTQIAGTNKGQSNTSNNNSGATGGTSSKTNSATTTNSGGTSGTSKNANADIVNGIDRSKLPKYARSSETGHYYVKDENNNYHKISYEDYQAGRKSEAAAQKPVTTAPKKTNEEIINDFKVQQQQATDNYWNNIAETQRKAEAFSANLASSFYAAQAVSSSKSNLKGLTKLDGNYANVEELEAEFNQKYYSINGEVENLTNARNQSLDASYNLLFSESNAKDQAIGQTAVLAGNVYNSLKADREKRLAKEALEQQKSEQKAKIEARKRAAMLQMRNGFISQFPDGGVPLSSHKVSVNELYFFSYTFDKSTMSAANPAAHVTNVFSISRYGDGTWPFKNTMVNELKKMGGAGTVTIMGYYTTKDLAEEMRASFLRLAGKCGIAVKETNYKGKKASGSSSGNDFWDNSGSKKTKAPAKTKTNAGDDFWETGNGKTNNTNDEPDVIPPSKKPSPKKDDDFWNN